MLATGPSVMRSEQRTDPAQRDRLEWWAAGFGAAAGAGLILLAHRALADDVWITLTYVRNLAEHGHWGLMLDQTSNTQTSPLNAWLLAGIFWVVRSPAVAVGVLLAVTLAVTGWLSARLAQRIGASAAMPFAVVALLVSTPLVVSTIGLETYLGIAMLVGVGHHALAGRSGATGVLWGLAVLCRPDLVVPAGVLVVVLLRRQRVRAAAIGALLALLWHVWSWVHLGGFVPDSTFIKVSEPGSHTMLTAPLGLFARFYPVSTALTAVTVGAGLCGGIWAWHHRRSTWARVALAFLLAGWAHWAALLSIGAYPQTWYFAPLVACSALTASIAIARIDGVLCCAGTALLAAFSLVSAGLAPWAAMPLVFNIARSDQYLAIGAEIPALTGGNRVRGPGEIGALAYGSGGLVVDHFGDRGLFKILLDQRSGAAGEDLLRLNWLHQHHASPPRLDYELHFASLLPDPPGQLVKTWQVDLPARGSDQLVLVKR
ncbi:hypothetical protein [Saccharopolyspora sp. NPDC049426]|uniref:hypothetical protein n=1 Tax=Saccharopolyspora sp. NPDC049426 TaxID=3155652 RepID=UPI0034220516